MWVKVLSAESDWLEGTLESEPDDMPLVPKGLTVRLPRTHVMDVIFEDPEREATLPPDPRREFWERCLVDQAVLDGAGEIAVPTFVATLSICIVFVPMFFLGGVARYLFVPLAEAVCFAMLASYVLSRTLVPTLAYLMLKDAGKPGPVGRWIHKVHVGFNARFEVFRASYVLLLGHLLVNRKKFLMSELSVGKQMIKKF
jgi:hypothetical protein